MGFSGLGVGGVQWPGSGWGSVAWSGCGQQGDGVCGAHRESGVGGLLPWGSGPWSGWGQQGWGSQGVRSGWGSGWVGPQGDGMGGAHTESCLVQATVGAIVSGGAAYVDVRLLIATYVGDEITHINHHSVMDALHRDVISLMGQAAALGDVMLGIRRWLSHRS